MITSRPAGASPLVTNEPIVSNTKPYEPPVEVGPIAAPTFSSYATEEKSGGGKFLQIAIVLVVLGAGGYFGWPKLKTSAFFSKVVQRISSSHTTAQTSTVASAPLARFAVAVKRPTTRLDFASRTVKETVGWTWSPSFRKIAWTRTLLVAISGAACTAVKCGVPERIN